jgi:hypothetical protein
VNRYNTYNRYNNGRSAKGGVCRAISRLINISERIHCKQRQFLMFWQKECRLQLQSELV